MISRHVGNSLASTFRQFDTYGRGKLQCLLSKRMPVRSCGPDGFVDAAESQRLLRRTGLQDSLQLVKSFGVIKGLPNIFLLLMFWHRHSRECWTSIYIYILMCFFREPGCLMSVCMCVVPSHSH